MRFLFVVILVICFVPTSLRAGDENPSQNSRVGDWVKYKYSTKDWHASVGRENQMTVIARDD
jgi:hypothetical protein